MSPYLLGLAGLLALLMLLPTRRLFLAGWDRPALTTYFVAMWSLAMLVALAEGPLRYVVPVLLLGYLAPFITFRAGIVRLVGGKGRPVRDVTPPKPDDRPAARG